MATYDAGIVTAYGAAVRGGYTGTYEQFCAQQANYAQSAAAVEQAKEDVQELVDSIPADYTQLSDDVSSLKEEISHIGGLSEDIKQAMLQIAEKVAYIDEHGQDYYDDLYDALYPSADLVSISAVYTQSGTVYDSDSLDSLKTDLIVTAHFSDSTTQTVTNYTLSGTLVEGTSTVTVTYGGKTTTFTVTVTDSRQLPTQYTWLYDPQSGDLLSEESYVTMETGGSGGIETIADGVLVLSCDSPPRTSTSTNFFRYYFTDDTTTNAKISTRSKIIKAPTTLVSQGLNGYRLQLSNGTNGAQAYFYNSDGYIMVGYYEGGTRKTVTTDFLVGDWHIFELEMSGTTQKLSIDGTEIFNVTSLSTYYCTANAMLNQAPNAAQANGVETQIDWFAYYES
jgi:hypothetical protein